MLCQQGEEEEEETVGKRIQWVWRGRVKSRKNYNIFIFFADREKNNFGL